MQFNLERAMNALFRLSLAFMLYWTTPSIGWGTQRYDIIAMHEFNLIARN